MFHVKHELAPRALGDFERLVAPWMEGVQRTGCAGRLLAHYDTLRRWSRIHDLIGPGTVEGALERHYGEALAALPLFGPAGCLVDVGSGAGFPGFVLAAALPQWRVYLVEPRMKRVAFLRAAARAAGLDISCLDVRVSLPLPEQLPARVDVVTMRALRLDPASAETLAVRLAPGGLWLSWGGREPDLPEALELMTSHPLPGRDAGSLYVGAPRRR